MIKKMTFVLASFGSFLLIAFAVAVPTQDKDSDRLGHRQPTFAAPISSQAHGFARSPSLPTSNFNQTSQVVTGQVANKPSDRETGWLFQTKAGEIVTCELAEPLTLTIQTSFGDLTIDSKDLISIRTLPVESPAKDAERADDQQLIVVATVSGDIFSGNCKIPLIKIKMNWGQATIDPQQLDFLSNKAFGQKTIVNRHNANNSSWVVSRFDVHQIQKRIPNQRYAVELVSPGTQLLPPPKY